MRVTWGRAGPRWVGVVCAISGLANIVGALGGPPELWSPGAVIGSVWAVLGFKGGPPLLESVRQGVTPEAERIAPGLRTIRRRRIATFLCLLAWLHGRAVVPRRT